MELFCYFGPMVFILVAFSRRPFGAGQGRVYAARFGHFSRCLFGGSVAGLLESPAYRAASSLGVLNSRDAEVPNPAP